MKFSAFRVLKFHLALLFCFSTTFVVSADQVSFFVDPATIDTNMDGFITGSEFQPVGSDGTIFDLLPTDNLTGGDRFLLSLTNGLHYGGGGGSTLSFDFSVDKRIQLESYTLSSNGFFLSNPSFNIQQGSVVLSSTNTSNASGDTHSFNGGPIELDPGTIYSFDVQVTGAAVQAFMGTWSYSRVPEPNSTIACLAVLVSLVSFRKRQ